MTKSELIENLLKQREKTQDDLRSSVMHGESYSELLLKSIESLDKTIMEIGKILEK